MESPQTKTSEDSSIQRLSALYQYHNAPEVAPAHGLEYDDTVHPFSSDKYPVIRELPLLRTKHDKYDFEAESNKPPRIIFGMKIRTFMMVALVLICVVIGAAVGGGVGGAQIRSTEGGDGGGQLGSSESGTSSPAGLNATTAAATSPTSNQGTPLTSVYVAPTPTYIPLSDCPAANGTRYVSTYASSQSGNVAPHAGLKFTKYCNFPNPFDLNQTSKITAAFVYSFNDCIEICAGYNFWRAEADSNCTVAVYQPGVQRPAVNCWVGNTGAADSSALAEIADQEASVAVVQPEAI